MLDTDIAELGRLTEALHAEVSTVAPIVGIAMGDPENRSTWRIDFDVGATPQQQDDAQAALAAFDIGAVPAPPYLLYKSVFIRRMTSDEAASMEAVLAAADAKLRLMFNSVEYFVSDDALFGTLTAAVGAVLGADRAAELLAAE